jgi:hypothetical protein
VSITGVRAVARTRTSSEADAAQGREHDGTRDGRLAGARAQARRARRARSRAGFPTRATAPTTCTSTRRQGDYVYLRSLAKGQPLDARARGRARRAIAKLPIPR